MTLVRLLILYSPLPVGSVDYSSLPNVTVTDPLPRYYNSRWTYPHRTTAATYQRVYVVAALPVGGPVTRLPAVTVTAPPSCHDQQRPTGVELALNAAPVCGCGCTRATFYPDVVAGCSALLYAFFGCPLVVACRLWWLFPGPAQRPRLITTYLPFWLPGVWTAYAAVEQRTATVGFCCCYALMPVSRLVLPVTTRT